MIEILSSDMDIEKAREREREKDRERKRNYSPSGRKYTPFEREVLDAGSRSGSILFEGPGDLVFTRFTVASAMELGKPRRASNTAAYWSTGSSTNASVAIVQYFPAPRGGSIRIKAGGAEGTRLHATLGDLARSIIRTYGQEVAT